MHSGPVHTSVDAGRGARRPAPRAPVDRWLGHLHLRARRALAAAVAPLLLVGSLALPAAAAGPAPVRGVLPPGPVPQTVTADALPTAQVDGVVYDAVVVGRTVWAVGDFSSARPAGVPRGGAGSQPSKGLVTFDALTGELTGPVHRLDGTPFSSTTNPGVYCDRVGTERYVCDTAFRVAAAPDGSRVYVGGDFTSVDGTARSRLAAFDTATGDLVAGFAPAVDDRVRALSVTSDTVYVGGAFRSVSGAARTRLAAVRTDGTVLPWAPTASDTVVALAADPVRDRVVVGGAFASVSGRAQQGLTAVRATGTGALAPWRDTPVPVGGSYVTDLELRGGVVYGAANGEGRPQFDGRFAATVTDGRMSWVDSCRGATQSVAVLRDVLYSAHHAHQCLSLDAFGELRPQYLRAFAQTLDARVTNPAGERVPQLLHWFPRPDDGPSSSPFQHGTWAVAASEDLGVLVLAGEFLTVNDGAQQGLVRFRLPADAPRKAGPEFPLAPPEPVSVAPGEVRVLVPSALDRDAAELSYELLRDGVTVATRTAVSAPYLRPDVAFTDGGLQPGASHTYRYRVTDPDGNSSGSPPAAPTRVAAGPVPPRGVAGALADGARRLWPLSDPAGSSAARDVVGGPSLAPSGDVVLGVPGPVPGGPTAARLGPGDHLTLTGDRVPGPQLFTAEAWVAVEPGSAGQVLGLADRQSGDSDDADRRVYVRTDGRLAFGVRPSDTFAGDPRQTVVSEERVDDGQWHHVAASLSPAGLRLHLDGRLVATDPGVKTAQPYAGWWRVGDDDTSSWAGGGGSGVQGAVADVAVSGLVLADEQVAARAGTPPPLALSAADLSLVCRGTACTVDSSALAPPGATVVVDLGDGSSATGRVVEHTYARPAAATVRVTVTTASGRTGTVERSLRLAGPRRVHYAS